VAFVLPQVRTLSHAYQQYARMGRQEQLAACDIPDSAADAAPPVLTGSGLTMEHGWPHATLHHRFPQPVLAHRDMSQCGVQDASEAHTRLSRSGFLPNQSSYHNAATIVSLSEMAQVQTQGLGACELLWSGT
jgi:hypothetical protein